MNILSKTLGCVFILFLLAACIPNTTSETRVADKTATPVDLSSQHITTQNQPNTTDITPTIENGVSGEPTLTVDQARAKVLDLLATNKECNLPCFWGIEPGITKWSEVKEFLRSISTQYSDDSNTTGKEFFYSNLYLPANDIQGQGDLNLELGVHGDIIRTISVNDFDIPNYHLEEFLLNNGEPDEIWIFTSNRGLVAEPEKTGFLVSLFYKNRQMIAAFGRGTATIGDDWISGCIKYSPSLRIWSLDEPLSFPDATNFFYGNNVTEEGWKQISEATQGEFDVNKFFITFSKQNTEACFRTPKSLWAEP